MSGDVDSFPSQEAALATLLRAQQLPVNDEQVALLDRYRRLLWAWNERMNLTRHTTLEKFAARDVTDSWQLAELTGRGGRVLDVGTGGGVPGMVMAILRPDLAVSLCDSTLKKAGAVEAIVAEMQLPVAVYACRAEEVLEVSTFDTLVARAVAPLAKMLRWFEPHWAAFDELLVIKGRNWAEERSEARHLGLLKECELRKAAEYVTPGTDAKSVVLRIWRKDDGLDDSMRG